MLPAIEYRIARAAIEFEDGRKLFEEYVASLDVDLSFQDFSKELQVIDRQYNQPDGTLLLAYYDGVAIACAGVRKLDDGTAELKRMYVKDSFKGQGVGVQLLQRSLQAARELGYEKIRLDTLQSMTRAQALYRSFGFYEIPSYRYNPLEGTVYMEKEL